MSYDDGIQPMPLKKDKLKGKYKYTDFKASAVGSWNNNDSDLGSLSNLN